MDPLEWISDLNQLRDQWKDSARNERHRKHPRESDGPHGHPTPPRPDLPRTHAVLEGRAQTSYLCIASVGGAPSHEEDHAYDAANDEETLRIGGAWITSRHKDPAIIRRVRILSLIGGGRVDTLAGCVLFDWRSGQGLSLCQAAADQAARETGRVEAADAEMAARLLRTLHEIERRCAMFPRPRSAGHAWWWIVGGTICLGGVLFLMRRRLLDAGQFGDEVAPR